jgi:hypothetical protein
MTGKPGGVSPFQDLRPGRIWDEHLRLGNSRLMEKNMLVDLTRQDELATDREHKNKYPGNNGETCDTWRWVETITKTGSRPGRDNLWVIFQQCRLKDKDYICFIEIVTRGIH